VFSYPVDGGKDQGDHGRLETQEDSLQHGGVDANTQVKPGEQQHQKKAGQHKGQASQEPAQPAASQCSEIDAQLVGLRARQYLVDGQHPVEFFFRNPFFLFHQLAPDHGDLGHRTTPGQESEPEKTQENLHFCLLPNSHAGRCLNFHNNT
jgi:hypothetical protein